MPKEQFRAYMAQQPEMHFCFVNDGSTDSTKAVLDDFVAQFPQQAVALHLSPNGGKAEAVRKGMLYLLKEYPHYPWLGYFDADLATPLNEIDRFFESIEKRPELRFVCGSRIKRMGATVNRNWLRHYLGRIFATFVSKILHLAVYDTQCGAKLIRPEQAKGIFQQEFLSPWLFDVELFARLIHQMGYKEVHEYVLEVPLETCIDKGNSRLKFSHMLKVPVDLLRIRQRYRKHIRAAIKKAGGKIG